MQTLNNTQAGMITSPYFSVDHFSDFDWRLWQCTAYRKRFLDQVMLRLRKFHWIQRGMPAAILPSHLEVSKLAILHGLPEAELPAFQKKWSSMKSTLYQCEDIDLQHYNHADWMTIPAFDKIVASMITESPTCRRLADLAASEVLHKGQWKHARVDHPPREEHAKVTTARNETETQNNEQGITCVPSPANVTIELRTAPIKYVAATTNTNTVVPTVPKAQPSPSTHHPLIDTPLSPSTWRIPDCKALEHIRLINTMGRERGNYIGQVGPCEYKFGLTDKDFNLRASQHTRDFDQFCLVWAEHCSNSTRAEALFKKDPRIQPRLIRKTTNKNRHREIVVIDAHCTESSIKQIYSYYVKLVNDEEREKLIASATSTTDETDGSNNNSDVSVGQQFSSLSMGAATNADYIALEREKLNFEREKFEKEHALKLKEMALQEQERSQRQPAYQQQPQAYDNRRDERYWASDMDAASILLQMHNYYNAQQSTPKETTERSDAPMKPRRYETRHAAVHQLCPITNRVLRTFRSLGTACAAGDRPQQLNRKQLIGAIEKGTLYQGFKWKIEN